MKIPLEPVDSVAVTILMDGYTDVFLEDQGPAKRLRRDDPDRPPWPRVPSAVLEGGTNYAALRAEFGFSALISVKVAGHERSLLFDAGVSPDGVVENMWRLSISPKDLEAIVISHGHHDHTTGLDGLVRALGRPNLPVIVHPEFWSRRRFAFPGREPYELPSPSKSALIGAGFEIIEEVQPSFLLDDSLLVTGEVDRTTEFEKGYPVHQAFRDGRWQPDPLILDDQAIVLNLRNQGLVVVTGCGHAGVVNTARYAKKLTGVEDIYAIIGGFHLTGRLFEPIIPQTCQALAELAPQYIAPGHCTGWRATYELAKRFPEGFIPTCVGTRFEL